MDPAPMKKLLVALFLLLPNIAWAQCNGVFPALTLCGNPTGAAGIPQAVPNSVLTGVPGGSPGQIQYNNSGAFGGFTMSGDVTVNTGTGAATIQPNAVTDSKINPGAANTVKGSLNGSATVDM